MIPAPAGRGPHKVAIVQELRALMTSHVGLVRTHDGLTHALGEICRIERATSAAPALVNMVSAAKLITAGALERRESRGGHFRSDFPAPDTRQQHRTFLTLAQANGIAEKHRGLSPSRSMQGHVQ